MGGRRVNVVTTVVACIVCFLAGMNIRPPSSVSTVLRQRNGHIDAHRIAVHGPHQQAGVGLDQHGLTRSPAATKSTAENAENEIFSSPTSNNKKAKGSQKKQSDANGVVKKPLSSLAAGSSSAAGTSPDPLSNASIQQRKCDGVVQRYRDYYEFSQEGEKLRAAHGVLNIIAFSRLWPPPFHGHGGMQFHAMHLYSQLAAQGHFVHVLVTGPPSGKQKKVHYKVNPETLHIQPATGDEVEDRSKVRLIVEQVPSEKNAEYSELWYENCLTAFKKLNKTTPFHVAHSESWAGVPNIYQVGLQMAVTWHGSMLDWFRNEINFIVHNYRMKGKMAGAHTASRMGSLGNSVAYEAYMLLTVPHHITISDSAASDLTDVNLVSRDRVHLIYNGVNAKNFKPDPSVRPKYLGSHKVDPSDFVVGCGGRLTDIKGHHQLSQAMDVVLRRHKEVTLLVAGTGGESARYESLKSKGLKVVLLGMMNQEALAQFYQSLDVFIDPFYQHHGLNTVMIEAVLSGVPIIATRLASAETTAPCSEFGLTFGLGKVDELVDAVEVLMKDEPLRKRISTNVRSRAIHLFTSSVMAGSYEALLYKAYLNPRPLEPIVGKVVCKKAYPAMCYREPIVKSPSTEKK